MANFPFKKKIYEVLRECVLPIFNNCVFEPVHFQRSVGFFFASSFFMLAFTPWDLRHWATWICSQISSTTLFSSVFWKKTTTKKQNP